MFGLWYLQRKHNTNWNSDNSQKVCSDRCNVQKYIGDSNISQLKVSLSAVWHIWDYSLNSSTQCEESATEK